MCRPCRTASRTMHVWPCLGRSSAREPRLVTRTSAIICRLWPIHRGRAAPIGHGKGQWSPSLLENYPQLAALRLHSHKQCAHFWWACGMLDVYVLRHITIDVDPLEGLWTPLQLCPKTLSPYESYPIKVHGGNPIYFFFFVLGFDGFFCFYLLCLIVF